MDTIKFAFFISLLAISSSSFACKEAALNEDFPIKNFDTYGSIIIAKIDSSKHDEKYRYNPLVSFQATVLESIKGELTVGDSFSGQAKKEVAHAVCPSQLDIGGVYLLALTSENDIYTLSRFSFPTKSEHVYFSKYISQIKAVLKK